MENVISSVNLALFIPAALALVLTPGPVVLYIITRSVDQGRKAGMISVVGSEIGNFAHVVAAALGLSAILLTSTLAFDVVKYLGAAYLIYLGIRKLMTPVEATDTNATPDSGRRIFLQGIAVAVLNPKTALFFFAFLPQFVDPSKGNIALQILFLGVVMVTLATLTDSFYAVTAGTAGRGLRGTKSWRRFQREVAGTVYIGLGLTAALAGGNRK